MKVVAVAAIVLGLSVLVGVSMLVGIAIGRAHAPVSAPTVVEPPDAEPLPMVGASIAATAKTAPDLVQPGIEGEPEGPLVLDVPVEQPAITTTFTAAESLGDVPTTASGYRFDDAGLDRRSFAVLLARKFGIGGQPRMSRSGAWLVTQPGADRPRVVVGPGPMVTWSFDSGSSTGATSAIDERPSASPDVSTPRQAEDLARAFLGDLGVPLDEADWQVDVASDGTSVTAWQVIAGQRTQLGWTLVLTPDGQIVQARGFAAAPIEIPGYPVLGALSALNRSKLPQWARLGPSLRSPAPSDQAATPATDTPTAFTFDGRPIGEVVLQELVIEGAELGLAQFRQPDGGLLVLPAYLLTADDGSTWSLVAVATPYVRLVPAVASSSAATTR